jgi:hypothetical protein
MPLDFVKIGRFEMAKVRIIQGTVVSGKTVSVGDVLDVDGSDYHFLVGAGRAVKYVEPEAVPEPEPKKEFGAFTKEVLESKKGRRK